MRDRLARLALALGSGAVFALAAPPTNSYPTLWLGMVGLALALSPGAAPDAGTRFTRAFFGGARGLCFGFGANMVALRFIPDVITRFTPLPAAAAWLALLLLSLFEGLRWALAAMVCRGALRLGLPGFVSLAIGVFAGTFVPTVLPWSPAGGLTPWPIMVQLADVIGERGVSGLMALTAGLLADAGLAFARRERRRGSIALAAAIAIPLATAGHGVVRMRQIDALRDRAPKAKVALVQPSVPPKTRWEPSAAPGILEKLTSLTRRAEQKNETSAALDLTIWPESAYPYAIGHKTRRAPMGDKAILPFGVQGPVLTGIAMSGEAGATYNSAAIAFADGVLTEPQDKVHLLWFGETVPLADRSAWMRRTFARGIGIVPGDRVVLQIAGPIRAGVLNCFEDTLPDAGREVMQAGPNLLVNVTNDAWFHPSQEGELHLRLSVLRAVELRRDLVRAVNLGPTSFVDAAGRVQKRLDPPFVGALVTEPALLDGAPTFYGRFGDAPLAALLLAVCAFRRLRRRLKARRAPASS